MNLAEMKTKSWFAYIVSFVSFVITIYSIPYINQLVTPYLASYAWAVLPITYLIAWLILIFLLPVLISFIVGMFAR
jgi:hypothetical protein